MFAVACVALLALTAGSPPRLLYDEPFYAVNIPLFHRYGLTAAFLNSLTGTAGPLHVFVQAAFEPLTRLHPPGMRLVNLLLMTVTACLVAVCSGRGDRYGRLLAGASVLAVPMTWVIAGMALTEAPAVLFVTLSLWLQRKGLESPANSGAVTRWFLLGGIALGIAAWGRQPYLLLAAAPLWSAARLPRLRAPALALLAAAAAVSAPLFLVWKGLVPPVDRAIQPTGISFPHLAMSLGYTGLCMLLLNPRFGGLSSRLVLVLAGVTGLADASLGGFVVDPVRSLADRLLPAPAAAAYGYLCGWLLLSCGVIVFAALAKLAWAGRDDPLAATVSLSLLILTVFPVVVMHQYSSRYSAMSLPFLVLAARPWSATGTVRVFAAAAGCAAGFFSLHGYFAG